MGGLDGWMDGAWIVKLETHVPKSRATGPMEAAEVGRRKTFRTVRFVPGKIAEAGSGGAPKAFCTLWVLICFAPLRFRGRLSPRHLGASFIS